MKTSGRLLFLCLAVGLLLESQAHPIADAEDATRNVGSDGTSVELSEILERGQDSSAEKGQRQNDHDVDESGHDIPFPS
uniref:Conotoxin ba1890.8 n=1 Tax=Conus bayani TaxID=2070216 RepID=CH0_CONBY|nr:RecName: Full=Conotoxin ba1890.8; Contains: RecName: Full=Conotoxin ba1560.9; Flags: Precursor [Conus bayani]